MAQRKRQTFLQGALILSLATILVKIVGALFKLPLASILGSEGLGYFMSAYTIFNFLNALAVAGLPVAVSKMVSERMALHKYRDIRRIFSSSFLLFSAVGILCSLIMGFCADTFANLVNMPEASYAMVALSPAVFFVCMMSIYRGYYQGLQNMTPTALSQIIEALSKLVFGLGLSLFVTQRGMAELNQSGTLFGNQVGSLAAGSKMVIQYGAAAAVLGVTISTLVGTLYLAIKHKRTGDGITKDMLKNSPKAQSRKSLVRKLIKIAIPVSMAAVVANLTSMIDLVSINSRLTVAVQNGAQTLLDMYPNALTGDSTAADLPTILYGAYSGIALTIFNLVPSITTTFGVSALPNVTACWARSDRAGTKLNIESVLRITSLIAFPAGCGLFFMARPILELLYSDLGQIEIAAPSLALLGISVIFVSLSIPINSILQAIGRVNLPVKLMIWGGIIKLLVNFFLVSIPGVNIKGAAIGNLCCYLFIVLTSLYALRQIVKLKFSYKSMFIKPLFAGLCCGIFAKLCYNVTGLILPGKLAAIAGIGFAVIVYAVVLILIKGIAKEDILMLPKGKKIARLLEKRGLI